MVKKNMSEKSKYIINILVDLVNEAYCLCKDDRHKIHEVEWLSQNNSISILGESEIRADAIIGIARSYIRDSLKDKVKRIEVLENYCIYNSSVLGNWLITEGENFKKFSTYLHYLENLRLTLKENISMAHE